MSIFTEDDLVVYLGRKEKTNEDKVYPKVSVMSRTIDVSPDIDLLKINKAGVTIGYEIKLLKYRKDWQRYNYVQIYEGIGESLLYFSYGIKSVYLIIAYDATLVPKKDENKILDKLEDVGEFLKLYGLEQIGLDKIRVVNNSVSSYINIVPVKYIFNPIGNRSKIDFWFREQSLRNGQFNYDKTLYGLIYS